MVNVALFTRAWIEIEQTINTGDKVGVALFTRAWIEITICAAFNTAKGVALFTRAWIEIYTQFTDFNNRYCRPLHEGVD